MNRTLTPHQLRVLLLVANGFSNDEIAARLKIGGATVDWHIGRVKRKLGCCTRIEMALRAWTDDLVQIEPLTYDGAVARQRLREFE